MGVGQAFREKKSKKTPKEGDNLKKKGGGLRNAAHCEMFSSACSSK